MVSASPSQSPTYEGYVSRNAGLYERGGFEGESYLYGIEHMLPYRPTAEQLRAFKGKRKRVVIDGRKTSKKSPSKLYLPLIVDTEYQTLPNPDLAPEFHGFVLGKLQQVRRGSIPLTVQVNTIRPSLAGVQTYLHPLFLKAFPKADPDIQRSKDPISSYLSALVPGSEIIPCSDPYDENLLAMRQERILRLDLFAHFAVADLYKVWPDGLIRDHLLKVTVDDEGQIDQGRRIKFEAEIPLGPKRAPARTRWLRMPALVSLGGVKFALELSVVDTSAMAGQAGASLAGFHACAGIPLESKDNYSKDQKAQMLIEMVAACDPKGVEAGAYKGLVKHTGGALEEALIRRGGYGDGNPFIEYAEGDVETLYRAIHSFERQFFDLYFSLGLEPYYKPPRMTVGSTVHQLLTASVFRLFEAGGKVLTKKQQKFILEHGFEPSRARGLAEHSTWAAANARVFGGRVLSTAPTLISRANAAICDMDLAGAYARAMDVQLLPIGRPVIDLKFTSRSRRNHYPTLGEYLRLHGGQFVPGAWQLLISVEDGKGQPIELPSDQDYFTSWSTPSIFQGDLTAEPGAWLDRTDLVKVRTRQITNSIFAADQLDWLDHCCSRDLRSFILKNAKVKAALFYPKDERIAGDDPGKLIEEFEKAESNGKKNTSEVKVRRGRTTVRTKEQEFHGWIGITVADLITGPLTRERNRWKPYTKMYELLREKGITSEAELDRLNAKQREQFDYLVNEHEGGYLSGAAGLIETSRTASKHPRDELAKLCSNTVYGDLVSPFFAMSNPCVGNNITSRVRSIIWYFEKACRAWNSITDGGLFDLNEVHDWRMPRGGLNEKNTIFAMKASPTDLQREGILLKPLGFSDPDPVLSWGWNGDRVVLERQSGSTEMDVSAARKLVDDLTLAHCRRMFSDKIAVIDPKRSPFTFEAKGIVQNAVTHGTANYYISGGQHGSYRADQPWTIKFRSYRPDTHKTILLPFFQQLLENPEAVDRTLYQDPFTVGTVLKVRRFRDGYKPYYSKSILEPGDTEYTVKVFREFTPSAFLFRTDAQERDFLNFHQRHRDIGGAENSSRSARGQSVESFFTDGRGILNYRQMMVEIEAAIRDGRTTIHPELTIQEHPSRTKALSMKRARLREMIAPEEVYTNEDPFTHDYDVADIPDEAWF